MFNFLKWNYKLLNPKDVTYMLWRYVGKKQKETNSVVKQRKLYILDFSTNISNIPTESTTFQNKAEHVWH